MQEDTTLHDKLCCALSIIQAHILVLEAGQNGKSAFGGAYMPEAGLEFAARVIYEVLPVVDAVEVK